MDAYLLTAKETAVRLGLTPATIRRKVCAGEIPSVRLGTGPRARIRISADELQDWLDSPLRSAGGASDPCAGTPLLLRQKDRTMTTRIEGAS